MAEQPNIVLIFPDQHRGDTMGCAGHPVVRTPRLDRLAAEGVHFRRCSTSSPVCMPARTSLITGQPVSRHGIWGNNLIEPDRHGPSHVRNVRDAGYQTAVIGKTHLWANNRLDGHTREHADILHDWGYEHVHELRDVVPTDDCRCYYADFLAERGRLRVFQDYMRQWWTGSKLHKSHPWEDGPSLLPVDEHVDMYCANTAADWIRGDHGGRPFYLQVCPTGPHTPFDSPPEYRDLYDPEAMPLALMDAPAEPVSPQVQQMLTASNLERMSVSHNRLMRSYYYGKVSLIDDAVGAVMAALRDQGLLDNTWVIYASDHGDMLGDHRLAQKKVFYEGALHIPLIIRPPGGMSGWQANGLTDHLDISATVLEAAGAPALVESPGVSLVSRVLAGPDALDAQAGKEVVFSEVEDYYSMARTDRYKMTVDARTRQPLELYDLEADPSELHNLVDDPAQQALRDEYLEKYFAPLLSQDGGKLEAYQRRVAEGLPIDTFDGALRRQFE